MPILFSHILGTTDRPLCPKIVGEIVGESKHSLAFVILRSLLHSIFLHAHERRKQKRKNNRTVRIRAVPSLVIGECSMPASVSNTRSFSVVVTLVIMWRKQRDNFGTLPKSGTLIPVCSEGSGWVRGRRRGLRLKGCHWLPKSQEPSTELGRPLWSTVQ